MTPKDFKDRSDKLSLFLGELFDVINEIGLSYDGKTINETGIVKESFLTIVQKVAGNIHGINCLLISEASYLEHNCQPIMLLLRGVVEDLWIGAYLVRLKDDLVSFQNEINVISLQYAKFSEFIIKREPAYGFVSKQFQGLSADERQKLIEQYLETFRDLHADLYASDVHGVKKLKSAEDLRSTSNKMHLKLKSPSGEERDWNKKEYKVSLLSEIIEFVGNENNEVLKLYNYTYFIYRALSQYQHFSLKASKEILNNEAEFELALGTKSIGVIYLLLVNQLSILGLSESQGLRLSKAFEKYSS